MQSDPLVEWQRLTETYSKMYDDELLDLAADSVDLTEVARQVLGDEMKKRGLEEQHAESTMPNAPSPPAVTQPGLGFDPSDAAKEGEESDPPHDFTWKTPLCECNDWEEARQLSEVLRRSGIESWTIGPGLYSPYAQLDQSSPRILVAADQLDQAREIAARPIPQEIIDQSKTEVPEFEPPVCPKCGAGDPVLEDVDPLNTWKCEACGNQWTELAANLNEDEEKTGQ